MRDWQQKLKSGEYIRKFRGYEPMIIGCFYGDSYKLGGEDKFTTNLSRKPTTLVVG